jgi:hypothetical protein
MKTRPLAAALLIALVPATLQAPVLAQPAGAEDPTTAMARARFKEGVDFYDKGEYEQARAAFLQAYALKKHPAVLLNLAWSTLKSGHALEAEKYFKQFLSEGKDITDKQRADANDGLTQSHAKLGRIEIAAAAGTEVTVDGERVGTTPLADPIAVEAGAHTVKFKGADGTTDTQSVSVLGGEKALAKFKGGAGASPTTTSTPPETTTTNPPPKPPETEPTKPPPETPPPPPPVTEHHGSNPLAPPNNLVPAIVLGAIGVGAFIGAGIMLVQRNQAQSKATQVANEIRSNIPAGRSASGICTNPPTGFQAPCNDFVTDNNDVNADATVGNVLVGVGIAALVGAGVYYFVANKTPAEGSRASAPHPLIELTPVLGRTQTGLSLTGSF